MILPLNAADYIITHLLLIKMHNLCTSVVVFCPVATHCTDVPGSIECDTSRMRWRSKSRGRPQLNSSFLEPVSSLAVVGRVL